MKKYLKIASIVMAFVMVITSVAFINTTTEAKSKVKKVTVVKAKKTMTLKVGDVKTYKVKVKAKKGKKAFTAKSTDPSVVSVKKKGKKITITALKAGNAKVVVKAKKNKKKKFVIKITVTDGKTPKPTKPTQPTTVAPVVPTTVAPQPTTKGQITTEENAGGFDNGSGDNIDDLTNP